MRNRPCSLRSEFGLTGAAAGSIMKAMDTTASPPIPFWKQRLTGKRPLLAIAGAAALGAAAAGLWQRAVVAPKRALSDRRFHSTIDIAKLYALQVSYKQARGAYANDLSALLSIAPDGAALKADLAANVDMNTLAVVGDAEKFKIEVNVLDDDRTLIKIKGPIAPRVAAAAPLLRTQAPPMNADGAPISSGR